MSRANERQAVADKFMEWQRGDVDLGANEAAKLTKDLVEMHADSPGSGEAQRKLAERFVWMFFEKTARLFWCGGVGYLMPFFSVGGVEAGVPVAVAKDDPNFGFLLTCLGIHQGGPMHRRVGAYLHGMCSQYGEKAQTRLGFHYDAATFTAYAAAERGMMVRVTRHGMERIGNGLDGVLFLYPEGFRPLLSRPLDEPVPDSGHAWDRIRRSLFADGFLARNIFGGPLAGNSSFEIRSMDERQVRRLVMAYLFFLMMPGVVSERAMLQALGPSGSGKTFFLELLGHVLTGRGFRVRPLPNDLREFENQIINEYFVVYDNVGGKAIPAEIKDRFCQAVTGCEVVRRVLFTTSAEARYESKATIALAAITPPLPELEHQNRTVTINFREREGGFIAKEILFEAVDDNRDEIVFNLLTRMVLVLEALEAQKDYRPTVNIRLASIATFILRVARHEDWEKDAKKLLEAWGEEQTGYALQDDDVSAALAAWMGRDSWRPGEELTATRLNRILRSAAGIADENLSWRGNPKSLGKALARNLKVYASRFGLHRRTHAVNHPCTYIFSPPPERLAEIRKEAADEMRGSAGQEEMPF